MSEHDEPTTEAPMTEVPASEADTETDETSDRVDTVHRIAEVEDAWRRTAAELDNVRKRCAQDALRGREQERATVTARWLPVVDNLERALEHASSEPDAVLEGVRAVLAQAVGVLADLGYPRRDDQGRAFDPAVHEAVSTVSADGLTPGTVAEVVRPGYGSNDKILRPAAVVVATRAP
ncbi:MAG: nucleotide exchange factor GrpE [Aeromicrobium sp.]